MREGPLLKATAEGRSLAPAPYQWADIEYRVIDPNEVKPTATYVLRRNLQNIAELGAELAGNGFDIFDLLGAVRIREDEFIIPPVLEVWNELPYLGVLVVVDGGHRLWKARELGVEVGCVVISGHIDSMLPVLPLDGWSDVTVCDQVPITKRHYAQIPKPYVPSDSYRVGIPGSTGIRQVGARSN